MKRNYTNITEKQALQYCFLMWDYIARNPGYNKYDYLKHIFCVSKHCVIINTCWTCYYNDIHQKCILMKCWNINRDDDICNYECVDNPNSPYYLYDEAKNNKDKSKYARQIANFCIKQIKEINTNER